MATAMRRRMGAGSAVFKQRSVVAGYVVGDDEHGLGRVERAGGYDRWLAQQPDQRAHDRFNEGVAEPAEWETNQGQCDRYSWPRRGNRHPGRAAGGAWAVGCVACWLPESVLGRRLPPILSQSTRDPRMTCSAAPDGHIFDLRDSLWTLLEI